MMEDYNDHLEEGSFMIPKYDQKRNNENVDDIENTNNTNYINIGIPREERENERKVNDFLHSFGYGKKVRGWGPLTYLNNTWYENLEAIEYLKSKCIEYNVGEKLKTFGSKTFGVLSYAGSKLKDGATAVIGTNAMNNISSTAGIGYNYVKEKAGSGYNYIKNKFVCGGRPSYEPGDNSGNFNDDDGKAGGYALADGDYEYESLDN